MKILQVVHGFAPRSRGGTWIYAYHLSKELSKRHEVYVLYPSQKPGIAGYSVNKHDSEGLHITELVNHRLSSPTLIALLNLKYVYRNSKAEKDFEVLLDEVGPDIVHFQHLANLSPSLIEIAKGRGVPTVLTLHDFWFLCPRITLLKSDYVICGGPDEQGKNCLDCWNKAQAEFSSELWTKYSIPKRGSKVLEELVLMAMNRSKKFHERNEYMKSLLLKVDKLIAPSRFLRNVFIEHGVPEDKIIYSRNGYDLSAFDGFKKKEKDKLVFGFAGIVAKHKGVHILVEAFRMVETKNAELRIYGNYDPRSNYLKELKAGIEGNNIKFMGEFVDVREPYSEIDVLVVPSIWYETGGPLVVIEALISKTPIIASNIGCMPEFVQHNKTGLLFQSGDPEDLYQKINLVIENPSLIREFQGNIQPVKTIQEQARELEGIYESVRPRSNRFKPSAHPP